MRKVLLGAATLIALVSPAVSADMRAPVYKAPPSAVPVWSWTGCYVGGHAGGLWAEQKEWIVRTSGGDFFGQSLGGHDADSWVGGVQAGCDYQFADRWVVGVFGDYDFGRLRGDFNPVGTTLVGDERLTSSWAAGATAGPCSIGWAMARSH